MVKAALFGGLALIVAGVAVVLRGLYGWGLLGLWAGFALVFGPLVSGALVRYGGAAAAAVMAVALLMPLAPRPPVDQRGGGPRPPVMPTPGPRTDATSEGAGAPAPAEAGPSEEARRAIFRELVLAEERAQREANATHPDRDSGSAVPDQERMVRRAEKRVRLARLLEERYRREIAVRYGVADERLPAILEEGRSQGWTGKAQ